MPLHQSQPNGIDESQVLIPKAPKEDLGLPEILSIQGEDLEYGQGFDEGQKLQGTVNIESPKKPCVPLHDDGR